MTTAAVQSTADALFPAADAAREKTRTGQADPQDRFLRLLVTQLRNQDPLNPMDNQQVTSQMAQISTVDGIERLNASLRALTDSASEGQALQAAALIARGVLVPGSGLAVANGMSVGGVELNSPADSVQVTIKDANGIPVKVLDLGALDVGTHGFAWDGTTDSGEAVAEGGYTISVTARQGNNDVEVEPLTYGIVSGVSREGGKVAIDVGLLGRFGFEDIRQIL